MTMQIRCDARAALRRAYYNHPYSRHCDHLRYLRENEKERSITFDKDLRCHQRDPGEVNPLTLVIHGQGHDMMIGPGRMVIV